MHKHTQISQRTVNVCVCVCAFSLSLFLSRHVCFIVGHNCFILINFVNLCPELMLAKTIGLCVCVREIAQQSHIVDWLHCVCECVFVECLINRLAMEHCFAKCAIPQTGLRVCSVAIIKQLDKQRGVTSLGVQTCVLTLKLGWGHWLVFDCLHSAL